MDRFHREGYFFVTRLKKYTKIFINQTIRFENKAGILRDELVQLGAKTTLTSLFRLVTLKDEQGRVFQFITNRTDGTAEEVAEMYEARWQIELFFKHIKQHMTIKTFFSQSEQRSIQPIPFNNDCLLIDCFSET